MRRNMINVILIDDERPALDELKYHLEKYDFINIALMLQDTSRLLEMIGQIHPDVIFLDIDMPGKSGIKIAGEIREINNDVIIVFVTAYSEYALESFGIYPLDYIVKPISTKRFNKTIEQIKNVIDKKQTDMEPEKTERIVRCFSKFEMYGKQNGHAAIKFQTRQTREMLAYLISKFDRQVTRNELIDNIFGGIEDKKTINLLHVTAYKIRRGLEDNGIESNSILISGNYQLSAAEGVCDYIDFMKFVCRNPYIDSGNINKAEQIAKLYSGPFLDEDDYKWADEIRAETELQYEKLLLLISDYYYEADEYEKYERTLLTLVNYDPLLEIGYLSLLDMYIERNKPEKFRQYYLEYSKMLSEEFETEPKEKYRTYFNSMISANFRIVSDTRDIIHKSI